jgi:hypothetical protein
MNKLAIALLVAVVLLAGVVIAAMEMGIFGTGYSEDQRLTDGQIAEMSRIALTDNGVQEQLKGYNYTIGGGGYYIEERWYPVYVKKVYPSVQIMVPEQHTYYTILIDLRQKAVLKILPDVLPYVPPGLNSTT